MNHGGDASEQVVRIMLEGTEVALKLTGSATKNVAAALYAVYKDNKKVRKGKGSLTEILKDGKDTRIFRMETKDLAKFKKYAQKYGIRYAAIKETNSKDSLCDVIIKAQDVSRVNHVLGKMEYIKMSPPEPITENEQSDPKKENRQRHNSNTQNPKSTGKEKADVQEILKDIRENNKENITPEKYKAYLILNGQMYNYSSKNKERILEQMPSASVVMSKTKWREIGRFPKQGAKGIIITMPEYKKGYRTGNFIDVKIFDVSETYGKDIKKSSFNLELKDNPPEIKSEIDRIKSASVVPIEVKSDLETDAFYDDKSKIIYIRDDLSDTDTYKALILEQSYAKAHVEHCEQYIRGNNRLMAESTAFMVATKYGIDTNEYAFDYIPDEVNGNDGKNLSELFNPITANGSKEINKAYKNLESFRSKDKASVKTELNTHKQAIEKGIFTNKAIPFKKPTNKGKGK